MARRWVQIENLGPRVNWQSLKRKSLEALGGATEASIKNGRMDRRRRTAVIEFAEEDEAQRVASAFDGHHDKVTSKNDDECWRAQAVTEAEGAAPLGAGGGPAGAGNDRASPSPARRRPSRSRSPRPRSASPDAGGRGPRRGGRRSRSHSRRSRSRRRPRDGMASERR
mmetsp:Transcript_66117/g.132686  ORF Transcript_66117/g.132686 Transcript_66117/m.132686 type:complete len:168 (-) Transcript_66117:186-689(-)